MTETDILDALREKAEMLQARLLAKVETNLSGEVLRARSGQLKASIVAELAVGATDVTATVASHGVPYAAIQELGGTTPAHDIVPVKARALAFAGGFARRVHHPGATIPARFYLGSALDAMRDEVTGGLKDAVLTALGAP